MKLPRGSLLRRRVVIDLSTPLETVLESEVTGYARLESQDTLLLEGDGVGVVTFEDGIPMVAYHTGTDRTGIEALDDIAMAGPYRVELYELTADVLADAHNSDELLVPPGTPAKRLAGDPALSERTVDRAPAERTVAGKTGDSLDAVESFLEDEQSIETLRDRAREEAKERADQWGFDLLDQT